jgi:hypothetical protein
MDISPELVIDGNSFKSEFYVKVLNRIKGLKDYMGPNSKPGEVEKPEKRVGRKIISKENEKVFFLSVSHLYMAVYGFLCFSLKPE